jgi:putative Mg2+ transporter-C (MgtC) family protein
MGSALFIVISQAAFDSAGISRVASTIVTGLGFLGAGTIIKEEHDIHGLTTAAGIWSIGAVGLGIGLGEYLLGCSGAFLIWLVLISERVFHFDERLRRKYVERSGHFKK